MTGISIANLGILIIVVVWAICIIVWAWCVASAQGDLDNELRPLLDRSRAEDEIRRREREVLR